MSSVIFAAAMAVGSAPAFAQGDPNGLFRHVGTFDVTANGSEVAEIVAAGRRGNILVYTDSATGSIGLVDIVDPSNPLPAGTLPVGGTPTSVAVLDGWALVGVSTGADFLSPDGSLVVVDLGTLSIAATIPLGGQPDSVAISADGTLAAITIENERDEDLDDGLIPQLPAGELAVVDLIGDPITWAVRHVDLTGLADIAPDDPEPEYVAINKLNEAVVSLQENNHFAVVDLASGAVLDHFSAGSVDLTHVDTLEDGLGPQERGLITLTDSVTRRREPDGVAWISDDVFASANEGDYEDASGEEGGSRGFTLFHKDGTVLFESAEGYDHGAARIGHYPEDRSENKGSEPESVLRAQFGDRTLLFVMAERANCIAVFDVTSGNPVELQMLPTGIAPEGITAIRSRNLLAAAAETAEGDTPSMITIYRSHKGAAPYPGILSADDAAGLPIPWAALSGLAGDPDDAGTLYTVSDSWLAEGYIFALDVTAHPAVIFDRITVTGLSFEPDFEGIAVAPEGGYWLASEGRIDARPNAIVHVDATGAALFEAELPDTLTAGMTDSGFEGVAATGDLTTEFVYAPIQREWADDLAGQVKIARYDVAAATWEFATYPLDPVESPNGGWVGLSEITLLEDGTFAIIERDNQLGPNNAAIKRVYGIDPATVTWRPHGDVLDVLGKTLLLDLLPDLQENSIWTVDKLEGLGVGADGTVYAVTDNDGLDEVTGQTLFLNLGDAF